MSKWIRQIHRCVAIIFAALVTGIFAALAMGEAPAQMVYYVPLVPLALLMLTGLYLFVLPYAEKWRGGRRAGGRE